MSEQENAQDEQENAQDEQKMDFASVFPAKGDPRRPPEWYGRALLYAAIAVFLAYFVWRSWSSVSGIVLDVVISLFLALAVEPLVLMLVRHGWRRGVAAVVSLVGVAVVVIALFALFGNMFVQQVVSMVSGLPAIYDEIADTVRQYTSFELPQIENLLSEVIDNLQTSWIADFAGQAVTTTVGVFGFLLDLVTVVMVTFYLSAAGPKLKRSLCQWFGPNTQRRFLLGWTIVQDQISNFLFSRTILAVINAFCTSVFLDLIHVQYWLPLGLFCGVVSQFIPTVGTYIGGALPVLFAWGGNGLAYAVAVLVFIIIYQQIENMILSPKISQRTMNLNPAIAFLAVLVFSNLFGALGAFLALPITASLQAMFKLYTKRYDLVDSPLLNDPKPLKKSKVVAGAEAFSERVIKPMSSHMPRAAKGSSARVPQNENLERLRELYDMPTSADLDDSRTVAIPKNILTKRNGAGGNKLAGTEGTIEADSLNALMYGTDDADDAADAVDAAAQTDCGDAGNGVARAADGADATEPADASGDADASHAADTGETANTAQPPAAWGTAGAPNRRNASDDNPRSRWR